MTEKEMIEEMAKVLCLFCKEMTEEKECERGKECYDWRLKEASFYYEQGYRKIPEGSVVLSKEEYERLTNQNKGLKEENGQLRLENNDLEAQVKKVRKETTKEILKKGEEFYKMSYHKSNAIHRLVEWIKDTFGVEVEE